MKRLVEIKAMNDGTPLVVPQEKHCLLQKDFFSLVSIEKWRRQCWKSCTCHMVIDENQIFLLINSVTFVTLFDGNDLISMDD